jgi:hypothetical protein
VVYSSVVRVYGDVFVGKLGEPKPECGEGGKHLLVVDVLVPVVARVWFREGRGLGKLAEVGIVCVLVGRDVGGGVVDSGVVDSGGAGGARLEGKEIATEAFVTGCVGPEKKGCTSRADDGYPVPRWWKTFPPAQIRLHVSGETTSLLCTARSRACARVVAGCIIESSKEAAAEGNDLAAERQKADKGLEFLKAELSFLERVLDKFSGFVKLCEWEPGFHSERVHFDATKFSCSAGDAFALLNAKAETVTDPLKLMTELCGSRGAWGADAEKIIEVVNSLELRVCLRVEYSMQRFGKQVKDVGCGAQAEG